MTLGFFFSRNMSVQRWKDLGLLDREKLIYERHIKDGNLERIYWFTYGLDESFKGEFLEKNIVIVPMPKLFNSKIGMFLYSFLMPFIQYKSIKQCDILKNDQMDGSWSAVISKIVFNKKLLIRTGFTLSLFMQQKGSKFKEFIAFLMEKFAYSFCNSATVSSVEAKNYIIKKYGIDNIEVMYNYIDTSIFKPLDNIQKNSSRLLFIGRLDEQKNIKNLLYALSKVGIALDIYGAGNLENELKELSKELNIDVKFLGKVKNSDMPMVLNSYEYYVLPSLYEGMPKTLLEAMACGLVCIGSDTLGINEVIEDNKNGFLIKNGFSSDDIVNSLSIVYNSQSDFTNIKLNAISKINEVFSLDSYSKKEASIFKGMLSE